MYTFIANHQKAIFSPKNNEINRILRLLKALLSLYELPLYLAAHYLLGSQMVPSRFEGYLPEIRDRFFGNYSILLVRFL